MRAITVFTHRRPADTSSALLEIVRAAQEEGVTLRLDEWETAKHEVPPQDCVILNAPVIDDVELCVVLGGDGTILRALQRYARTGVPVFAVNYGEIGFLATVEPDQLGEGFRRALSGDCELLRLPAIGLETPTGLQMAINDVAIHRKVGERVADLAYALDGEEVGNVRCDGLVVATPAGSTGYNLANGGPVMAWGVAGFAVSFIAPHSLTARALVVAPGDRLTVYNRSQYPLDVSVDGRPATEIGPAATITASFLDDVGTLAQLPGSSFYRRLREKFGRLAR